MGTDKKGKTGQAWGVLPIWLKIGIGTALALIIAGTIVSFVNKPNKNEAGGSSTSDPGIGIGPSTPAPPTPTQTPYTWSSWASNSLSGDSQAFIVEPTSEYWPESPLACTGADLNGGNCRYLVYSVWGAQTCREVCDASVDCVGYTIQLNGDLCTFEKGPNYTLAFDDTLTSYTKEFD